MKAATKRTPRAPVTAEAMRRINVGRAVTRRIAEICSRNASWPEELRMELIGQQVLAIVEGRDGR